MTEFVVPDYHAAVLDTLSGHGIGVFTLNRPRALNSLNHSMVLGLWQVLNAWEKDEHIVAVVLQGAGEKAFCAGGDVRDIYTLIRDDATFPNPVVADYFLSEYRVDYLIHRFTKPLMVWGDGVVMGGGMGLMQGASHRVVTENTLMAMPENTIGIFPDVGASWFLNQMPQGAGQYAGMTGLRMGSADALFGGLADHCVAANSRSSMVVAMLESEWKADAVSDKALLTTLLSAYAHEEIDPSQSELKRQFDQDTLAVNATSAHEFVQTVQALAVTSDWHAQNAERMQAASPLALNVIWQQLQRSGDWSLEQVFLSEMNLIMRTTAYPDFCEGIRALLVDKDNQPNWQHGGVNEVSEELVASLLENVWADDNNPLRDYLQSI